MHYLQHLARLGACDIHPGGAHASLLLLRSLQLEPGMTVLEIGCGTGRTLCRVAQCDPATLVGIDILPEMLAATTRRLQSQQLGQVAVVFGSARQLPFRDCQFDRVYAESVLGMQEAVNITAALAEIRRVLKPAGICSFNDAIWRATVTAEEIAAANRDCERDFGLRQASSEPWRLDDWLGACRAVGFETLSWDLLSKLQVHQPDRWFRLVASWPMRWWALVRQRMLARAPELRQQRRRYSVSLRTHRALGGLIETRLFVMRRNPA